ncbi:MAG: AraC family transcriptional regulator [Firmicutes bacterium]|nr:AraC family transcriptional regulator [Bacillota bacterium]
MKETFIFKKMEKISCDYKHPSYYLERKLINEIKRGSFEQATKTLNAINSIERATLADNPIRSLKNSLIAGCALYARAALEANVNSEDVFTQSDVFILEIERLNNVKELQEFEYHMVKKYIKMINRIRTIRYSSHITKIINHIHENITESITLNDFSSLTNKSKEYISALFKKEVGVTLIDYIQIQKIEESKNFLEFTDLNINQIALLFNFCNSGYFSKVFKKHTGIKPSVYRSNKNYITEHK